MNPTQKRHLIAILAMLSLLTLVFAAPKAVDAQSGTAAEMHQQINDLRAANGLAPLAVNSYLMQSAQNHANWIAAGNPGGHTGEDGSTAYDRALAVGYGEGAEIWVTENWARGYSLTVYDCIYVMWDDAAHMGNMLTTWHNEFGAGVALDVQGMTVYVVNFGHTSGVAPQPTATGPTATPGGPTSTPAGPTNTPVPFIQPVITSTPNPDGSVVHIVQFGQTLWGIVDAYGIEMADLLALNNLTEESPIYENQALFFFNLIPLAPLDGEKVVTYFLPDHWVEFYDRIRPYSPLILLAVVFLLPMFGIDLIGLIIRRPMNSLALFLIGR